MDRPAQYRFSNQPVYSLIFFQPIDYLTTKTPCFERWILTPMPLEGAFGFSSKPRVRTEPPDAIEGGEITTDSRTSRCTNEFSATDERGISPTPSFVYTGRSMASFMTSRIVIFLSTVCRCVRFRSLCQKEMTARFGFDQIKITCQHKFYSPSNPRLSAVNHERNC